MAFPLSFTRRPKSDRRRSAGYRHDVALEAVREHLDKVEVGSPLLFPF
jgi:hypothetical protein